MSWLFTSERSQAGVIWSLCGLVAARFWRFFFSYFILSVVLLLGLLDPV